MTTAGRLRRKNEGIESKGKMLRPGSALFAIRRPINGAAAPIQCAPPTVLLVHWTILVLRLLVWQIN
jgi:hypothetical protein